MWWVLAMALTAEGLTTTTTTTPPPPSSQLLLSRRRASAAVVLVSSQLLADASQAQESLPADVFVGEWRVEREPGSSATPMGVSRVAEFQASRFAENRASEQYDVRFTDGFLAEEPRRDDNTEARVVRRVFVPVAKRVFDATEYAFVTCTPDSSGEPVVFARKTATRWRWDTDDRPTALDGDELVHYYLPGPFDDLMFVLVPNYPLPVLALRSHLRLRRR